MINEEVIRVLDFPENVRKKSGMYLDSADSCLREVLDNATDESFTWKGCDQILIDTDFNGYNIVADNGRGIPISMSIDRPGQTQADVSISVLHSGSKFSANGQNATVGTHGVGSACANALSERYILMSKITPENYNRSIPDVEKLWNSKGPRSKKNLYYFVEYSKGYKITESAGTLEDIEKYVFQGSPKGYKSIPVGYSTIVIFKVDPEIWGTTKTNLPLQNIRNFLLIQEKFNKRKVTVVANGEVMEGSGFIPYQFEIMKTIIPADPSANPDIKIYITFDIDKATLGPKQIGASMNGLDCGAGIHVQYAESCFETALKNEYKIKHRMLTPGLRMFALFLAGDVQYSSQTKERCKSITKVKITDFNDITREFQKIFRANPEYWESHVEVLEKLAESFKNLTASEKAEKLQVGNSVSAAYKLKNELGSKLVDATAGPSERWDTELFLCFTGDTEMLTCNNERVSMVDLERRISSGEAIYTFSCEPSGRIVPSKIIAARQVGFSDVLCKVTLDNGETFECTPDHLHMMRDGSYKEARDLIPGDSMMPATSIKDTILINSIELIEKPGTPVYCLEVDSKEHNFPLAAGIFTKNCEGLSAAGSLVKGRKNSRTAGVMPLRGRVLNVDGLSVDQMLENKEFYTIFRAIGVGLDVNYVGSDCSSPEEAFEKIKKSSRYGKIIISTDADADGEAIANGLCYAISRFARFLIDFGMVYLVESPFFKDYQGRYYFPSDPVVPGTEFPVGLDTSKPFKRFKGLTYTSPVLW